MKIILISFLLNILSGWDIIRTIGLTKILDDKKLELLALMILFDLSKGVFLFQYINLLPGNTWLFYSVVFVILMCSIIKYYYFKNMLYFLPLLGYLWPLFPEIVNTSVALLIIYLITFKSTVYVKQFVTLLISLILYLATNSISLVILLLSLMFFCKKKYKVFTFSSFHS